MGTRKNTSFLFGLKQLLISGFHMKIRGQDWTETKEHLVIFLNQPYWGAWSKYGWEKGVEGFGVSREALQKALDLQKKIKVRFKYAAYEILAAKALEVASKNIYVPRDGQELIVIPRTAFDKVS
jgi:hypothetical protein